MKVTLVSTVKDAGPTIGDFLESVRSQTRPPDEVIVVDGGSADGTFEALAGAVGIRALQEPGASIARGRNLAIRAAAHDVIAVTDADCVLAPDWLERLLEPMRTGADVAAGFYRPLATTFLQRCAAAVAVRDHDELKDGWLPSSRSIAFTRAAYEAAGGYPEWLTIGEDMYFNLRLVESGARIELAPNAVVSWRVRPSLAATWTQYLRYAEGDALGRMYPERHAVRFGAYAFGAAALASRHPALLAVAGLGAAAYAARPLRRAWRRLEGPAHRAAGVAVVPALMVLVDAAKMSGYVRGLLRRGRAGLGPVADRRR